MIYTILTTSEEIDGIVLLAMDAVYSAETGELEEQKTNLWVSNRFLYRTVNALNERLHNESDPSKRNKRFFFGASVSPNRKDWAQELEYVMTETNSVLIKLIPSAQHIYLDIKTTIWPSPPITCPSSATWDLNTLSPREYARGSSTISDTSRYPSSTV